MNIIFGNYGNGTIALIQWAFEQKLENVTVISINTGWATQGWSAHVERAQRWVEFCGFKVIELKSPSSFDDLVRARKQFPSLKFQWCPLLLKGIPLLNWLDDLDPSCLSTILLAKRRAHRRNIDLPEWIDSSEHYGGRTLRYPLFNCDDEFLKGLINRAGFRYLPHRSLECDPCIHNQSLDFQRTSVEDLLKLDQLEKAVNQTMFEQPILIMRDRASEKTTDLTALGCADPFACGE